MLTNMKHKIKTHQGFYHTQNIQTCNDKKKHHANKLNQETKAKNKPTKLSKR